MNRRDAKREACGLTAAQLSADLDAGAWEDQGLLDDYSEDDIARIRAAAGELLDELRRRGTGA